MGIDRRALILELARESETFTKKEAVAAVPPYYHNTNKHVGEIISRLVKRGTLIRVSRGVFKLNTKCQESDILPRQSSGFGPLFSQ